MKIRRFVLKPDDGDDLDVPPGWIPFLVEPLLPPWARSAFAASGIPLTESFVVHAYEQPLPPSPQDAYTDPVKSWQES